MGRAVSGTNDEWLCARHFVEASYESDLYETLERLESEDIEGLGIHRTEANTEAILREIKAQYPGMVEAFEKVFSNYL
ncbi:hypothetical protein SVXNc_0747 [Candidatus Nanohalococcus occultus]|uniref:Uncharacterized protein n=1 Tax=Candidatus Nanohalococcus occultus TaxID=2978047 RepID=A0ABY8CEV8_9ARCH|nr:hypothetical protein SVXNc_0747 [Candidatus Nanohaloarchaeota archaeon SVXNc]